MIHLRLSPFLSLLAIALASPAARAHFDLDQAGTHLSRYGINEIKKRPCGRDGGLRGTHPYTYASGQTITVKIAEFVSHPGYFRIAFDDNGDDDFMDPRTINPLNRPCMSDPADHCGKDDFYNNKTVLMDNLDPHNYGQAPTPHSWDVKLPDVECDNCTLEIIQVMTDPPGIHAPYDPSGPVRDDIYFQCIDLVLKRSTDGGATDGAGGAGDAATVPLPALDAAGGASGTGAAASGAKNNGGASGCGCSMPRSSTSRGALAALGLAAFALLRRARRR